jgi:hypothetical protein
MSDKIWTIEELRILKTCCDSVLDCELQDLLPNKPWKSIQYKLRQLKINRTIIPDRILTKIKVNVDTDCWEWIASLNWDGYAKTSMGYRFDNSRHNVILSRYFYEEYVAKIPKNFEIDHLCKNRKCVNPQHLEAVTHYENIQRADYKIYHTLNKKTHCKRGHEFDKINTRINKKGTRDCRACHRLYAKKQRQKRKRKFN